ncbi:DUF402 domain-containing protein [Traorella massiliensis]|uniref:DUF402 domain-containing protein n=1 Tax=Traorella massiliensis TaxID=1903263 RepID=UPI0023577C53|nr:DUF402 domain-containing protein [Traorella massiliensis]
MIIKKKDMCKTNWNRCLEKEYKYQKFEFDGLEGIVSLSKFNKLVAPLVINYEFGDIKIADDNYVWLQFAFKNQNFWLTAMYDDEEELIELYFDITNGNYFDDLKNPYFYDLFLDIVVTKQKKIYVIDQDELQMAFDDNTITKEEYDRALDTADRLYHYLNENVDSIIEYCHQCLQEMNFDISNSIDYE